MRRRKIIPDGIVTQILASQVSTDGYAAEILDISMGATEVQLPLHAVPTPAGVVRFVVSISYLHHFR